MNVGVTAATAVAASTLATVSLAGGLDPGFGTAGKVLTAFAGRSSNIAALVVQPDGRIVAAGTAWSSPEDGDFALTRYNPDGSLDQTFGAGGLVTTDFGRSDSALSVVVQPDAKIVAGGIAGGDFALAHYMPDGTLDVTFGEAARWSGTSERPTPSCESSLHEEGASSPWARAEIAPSGQRTISSSWLGTAPTGRSTAALAGGAEWPCAPAI